MMIISSCDFWNVEMHWFVLKSWGCWSCAWEACCAASLHSALNPGASLESVARGAFSKVKCTRNTPDFCRTVTKVIVLSGEMLCISYRLLDHPNSRGASFSFCLLILFKWRIPTCSWALPSGRRQMLALLRCRQESAAAWRVLCTYLRKWWIQKEFLDFDLLLFWSEARRKKGPLVNYWVDFWIQISGFCWVKY